MNYGLLVKAQFVCDLQNILVCGMYEKKFASFTYYYLSPHLILLSAKVSDMEELCQHIQTVWDQRDQHVIDRAVQECVCIRLYGLV